jgi:hypothetical protein
MMTTLLLILTSLWACVSTVRLIQTLRQYRGPEEQAIDETIKKFGKKFGKQLDRSTFLAREAEWVPWLKYRKAELQRKRAELRQRHRQRATS